MRKILSVLLILVLTLIFVQQVHAGIIDWDRKSGLRRVEGTIISIDRRNNQVTVKNSTNGRNATYNAAPDLLAGLMENDRVLLKYKRNTTNAHSIDKK